MPKGGKGRLSEDSSASDHTLPDVPDNPEDEQSTSEASYRSGPRLCKVCENAPGIPIYRSIACGSCRIFFLRHSVPQKTMLCKFGSNCSLSSGRSSPKCVACRYQKCLDAGLQPLLAGRRTHCKRGLKESPPRKESPDEASDAVASLVAGTDIIRDFEMSALIFPSAFQVRLDDTDTVCVESLVQLESFCLQDDTDTPLDLSFDWNTDMHFGELMANPTLVCPRVPAGYDRFPPVTEAIPEKFLGMCFARGILQLTDWLRATPEVRDLDVKDRVALGVSLYPVTSLLQAFYYSFKNRLKGMAGGFNTDIQWEGIPTIPILADYFTKVGAYARTMIFPPLEKIQLTQQEYVIFKNIVIFTSVVGLSDEGADIIRRGRHRYEAKLLQMMKTRLSNDSAHVFEQYTLLMTVRSRVLSIAQRVAPLIGKCCTMNTGGLMASRLAVDVFFQ